MGMCADGNCAECVAAREKADIARTLARGNAPETFHDWHDAFKRRNRMGRILRTRDGQPYVKPDTGEAKGKKAIRAAKREKVKALKAANRHK